MLSLSGGEEPRTQEGDSLSDYMAFRSESYRLG